MKDHHRLHPHRVSRWAWHGGVRREPKDARRRQVSGVWWAVGWLPLLAVVATYVGAGGELERFRGLEGRLDIAGGTAHIPVMEEAAKRIMEFNPRIRITIAGGGSGVGVRKLADGLVDIGNTGRPLTEEEKESFGLETFPFAVDGIAVVVHPENPVEGLSSEQVRRIFAGELRKWSEVGGGEGAIHLYTRDEASGTRTVFWKKLLEKGPIDQRAVVVPSNGAMRVAVSEDPLAIGYLSIGHVDSTVKALPIDGVLPSQENAASGTYWVARKLYMNTKGKPQGLAKAFIEYILGPEGAEIIRNKGYIPLSPSPEGGDTR